MKVSAKALRGGAKCVPKGKPGVYSWWADRTGLNVILSALGLEFEKVKNCLEREEDEYCIYVGIAVKEDVRSRLDWHVNQINTPYAVKSGFLSTLRQSLAAVLGTEMTDTDGVNAFMDGLFVRYTLLDFPVKSQQAADAAHEWENAKLNGGALYLLNIQNNRSHPLSPRKKLSELRKLSKQKALSQQE